MNMLSSMNRLYLKDILQAICLLCLVYPNLGSAQTTPDDHQCTDIRASIERLACFDTLHKTPLYSAAIPPAPEPPARETLVGLMWKQEAQRDANSYNMLASRALEDTHSEQERVIITAPALGVIGTRPLFAASCSNNITRLQWLLPKAIDAHRIRVTLHNEHKMYLGQGQWRITENGYAIDVGWGIPSIRLLKKISGHKRLYLESDQPQINGISFDTEKLSTYLSQLQSACHWIRG